MALHKRLVKWLRRYRIDTRGLVMVGAHTGSEAPHFTGAGFARQVWVEPQPAVFARLLHNLPKGDLVRAFNVACGASHGEATMHVLENNDGQSNSLLKPKLHLQAFPHITPGGTMQVPVVPLDDLLTQHGLRATDFSLLAMDVQGYEMEVLKGAKQVLQSVEAILTEVSTTELYESSPLLPDMDRFLSGAGFTRVRTRLKKTGYGDAFYVRAGKLTGLDRTLLRVLGPGRR
jgi:FkbM family methyltransferase